MDAAFPESVHTGKSRDVGALYCMFLGQYCIRKGKAFLLLNETEMHTKVEEAVGRKLG